MLDRLEIFQDIARGIADTNLAFPTSARVTMRLREALSNPDCHVDAAARLLQAEPVLAARVVAMANSIAYNPYGREVSDLRSAVSRLGFSTLRSLCMAQLTRQLAGASLSADLQPLADLLWEHTAHVASLARVLARRVTSVDPEAALFAGIVHEVAGFYLLSFGGRYPDLIDDDCQAWVEGGERCVGEALLAVLDIPQNIRDALAIYWDGYLGMPPTGLGDTLLLAEELVPVASPLHRLRDERRGERGSAEIDMLIGERMLTEILAESAEEVASLSLALRF